MDKPFISTFREVSSSSDFVWRLVLRIGLLKKEMKKIYY